MTKESRQANRIDGSSQIRIDDEVLARFKNYEYDLKVYRQLEQSGQLDADMRKPTPPSFDDLPF